MSKMSLIQSSLCSLPMSFVRREWRLFFMLFSLLPLSVFAQEKSWLVGIGQSSQLDTYLSQEHYKGPELRIINQTEFCSKDSLWTTQLQNTLSAAYTKPQSKSGRELSGQYNIQVALLHDMNEFLSPYVSVQNLTISAGAAAELFVGGVYNTRNGNNPAQLRLGMDIAPKVKSTYGFSLWHRDFRVGYEGMLPVIGVAFSPNYGQSYYEIFSEGNYNHNVCLTSPFNAFSYSHQLTLDIPMNKGALRVGYLGDYRQAKLNNIKTHQFTHSLLLGWRF